MLVVRCKQFLQPVRLLFTNAAWLLGAELLAKVSRILTIIVLAVALTPVSYGSAMLALACHEMMALLLRAGAGVQIIRCNDEQLTDYAKNGATLQWTICLLLALFQCLMAQFIGHWYDNPDLVWLIQVMAGTYLFYPWVSIKIFLLQRANKMRLFSIYSGICITAENLSIALFAWMGADFMAVAYAKVIFSLLWLILFSFVPVQSYGLGFNRIVLTSLLRTSGKIFGSEFLRALRLHADTFMAAKVLSPELFGFYSFAKNAGIGLSQSLTNVFNSALYPFLCKLERQKVLLLHRKMVFAITLGVGMLFVIQAVLVPFYVPILFDEKWFDMLPVVSIMCLVALPSIVVDTACNFKRATGHFTDEIIIRFVCLLITLFALFVIFPTQPMDFACVVLLSSVLWCVVIYFGQHFIEKLAHFLLFILRRKSHEY